jgi:hypothetical protein
MHADLKALATSVKTIATIRDWDVLDDGWMEFISPLDIEGVTVLGLQLRMRARKSLPDECVIGQLECIGKRNKHEPLVRAEWRPLSGHNNKGKGPAELQFVQIDGTHLHPFDLNYDSISNTMVGANLPIAIPHQDIDSYHKFLDLCANSFKIGNMTSVPLPPWEPSLT